MTRSSHQSYNDFGPAFVRRVLKSFLWSRTVYPPLFYPIFSHFLIQLLVGRLLSPFIRPLSSPSLTTIYAAQIPNSASSARSLVHELKAMIPSRCVPHSRYCIQRRVNRSPSIWTTTARCSTSLNVSTRKNTSSAGTPFLVRIPLVLAEA